MVIRKHPPKSFFSMKYQFKNTQKIETCGFIALTPRGVRWSGTFFAKKMRTEYSSVVLKYELNPTSIRGVMIDLRFWKSENLRIWESENLKIWKSENQKSENPKIYWHRIYACNFMNNSHTNVLIDNYESLTYSTYSLYYWLYVDHM